jgi:hypothetical protein
VRQSHTKQFYVTCQSRKHSGTNHPEYKDKDIIFFRRKLETLTSCPNIMVKSSKTESENSFYRASYSLALEGVVHSCRNLNYNIYRRNDNLHAWQSQKINLKPFTYVIILIAVTLSICQRM